MLNKNIFAAAALILLGTSIQVKAQDITVAGTVKDVYGNPLPGVIVSANHKDLYITDKNGQYTAKVGKSEDLEFSLLGYKPTSVKASSQADVVLEDDAHNLAETVNIGLSKQSRELLTDAVSTASGEQLGKSLMSRLQGSFSGMFSGLTTMETSFEPGYESLNMYIRGFSTFHGGVAGVVIDGILYDSFAHDILYRISPEEVESVSILKDGASQAIYGVKGSDGLIVINTKRGTPGKLKVGVNISETVQTPTSKIRSFDSYTFAGLRNQAAANDGLGEFHYFPQEALEGFKNGGDELYPNTDWYGMLVRDFSNQQRISLDATGGNENVRFYSNFNVLRQGSFWNTDQKDYKSDNEKFRVNFRSNVDVKVSKYLSLWANLAGSIVKSHTPGGAVNNNGNIYNLITKMPSYIYGPVTPTIYDEEGNVVEQGGEVTTSTNINASPYGMLNRSGYSNETNTNIYGQAGIKLDLSFLTPGLWIGGSVGYLSYITANMATTQNYARFIRNDDWNNLEFTKFGTTINDNLKYSKGQSLYGYLSYKGEAGWQRDFGKHHLNANAYATYQEFDNFTGGATYDFRRVYTGAELAYDFDKRYAVKLSTGYSGSDYFPRKTRFVWTPGVSAAWIASNESFIRESMPWLSLLKIRGSYAITGNDATGFDRYAYKDQVTSTTGGLIPYLGYYTNESAYGNPNLEPEKIHKANIGIDLGVANQLQVSFDVFKEKMTNGVISSTAKVPLYQGIPLGAYPITNMGEYENKGWELSVSYKKRFNSDFALFVAGHLDYSKNKVIYVGETAYNESYAYRYRTEGYPVGQSWGYLTDYSNGSGLYNFQDEIEAGPKYSFGTPRLGDIKYKDLNNDGVIDEKDLAPIGNGSLPKYNFAFNVGFNVKNFEVSLLFQGIGDYDKNYGELISYQSANDGIFTESHKSAWTAEKWLNDEEISFPALSTTSTTSNRTNDFLLKDASFLRLKTAEISYKMPKKVCDFLNASAFKVYLSGQNLFTIDGMKTNDTPVEGSVLNFPVYRMYRLGINLTF